MAYRMVFILWLVGVVMVDAAERPTHVPFQSQRPVTYSQHGMVATSHPLAAQIGLDILQKGGNAIDAAIATNAAMGLMEPMSCGIGGDLFAIVWDAKTQKLYGLNASGRVPYASTREYFAGKGLKEIPETGPLSWSVPGCVDGWEVLREKFGTLPLSTLLAPSIRYAEEGFPVPEVIGGYWKGAEKKLAQSADAATVYLRGGRAPAVGTLMKNPSLAASYRIIAKEGRDGFYTGPIAQELDAFSKAQGGLLTARDLADHTSTWVDPVSTTYRGYDVWELPPPGQGIAVLQMLNVLEPYNLRKLGPTSPDYWHTLLEAKKLAYADRAKYYADPAFGKVPTAALISKEYALQQGKRIDPKSSAKNLLAGDPKLGQSDTIYLCVVDKDRNCVSLIQSNYHGFGSGLASAKLGFALQNRGTLLALDPNHANCLEPHKRPFHTIIPAMVTQGGKPVFVFGVMGGDMQPQGHVQVLVNRLDFGMNLQAAGDSPRMEHVGSATPTGRVETPPGGIVRYEPGFPEALLTELRRRGHRLEMVKTNGGGYQGIWIDEKTNMLQGGTESRKDGAALGY